MTPDSYYLLSNRESRTTIVLYVALLLLPKNVQHVNKITFYDRDRARTSDKIDDR